MTATASTPEMSKHSGPRDTEDPALHVEGLWKIFGPKADKIIGTPDADLSRADLKRRPAASSE